MSQRREDDDNDDVVPMSTDTDEVNPTEWLDALESSNAAEATKEYKKLSALIKRSFFMVGSI